MHSYCRTSTNDPKPQTNRIQRLSIDIGFSGSGQNLLDHYQKFANNGLYLCDRPPIFAITSILMSDRPHRNTVCELASTARFGSKNLTIGLLPPRLSRFQHNLVATLVPCLRKFYKHSQPVVSHYLVDHSWSYLLGAKSFLFVTLPAGSSFSY